MILIEFSDKKFSPWSQKSRNAFGNKRKTPVLLGKSKNINETKEKQQTWTKKRA